MRKLSNRNHRRGVSLCAFLAAAVAPGGCTVLAPDESGGDAIDPNTPPITRGQWYKPLIGTTWQWQLQPDAAGALNTSYAVDLYDLDLFEVSAERVAELHARGLKVIAYFSAGTFEDFRPDSGQFLADELGKPLDDFADERWLDVRSDNVRQIMLARLDLAVAKGFDGVEPDNVDGYANDNGLDLSGDDQLAFNRFIANEARSRGLAVGLKNDLEQIPQLVEYFDFAVNEQCHEFDECDRLAAFIAAGKPVFNAEYASRFIDNSAARGALCDDARARSFRTLVLPVALDDSFRLSCGP
jgi:hypothetical protein